MSEDYNAYSTEYCANCKKEVVLKREDYVDCTFWRCPVCDRVLDKDFDDLIWDDDDESDHCEDDDLIDDEPVASCDRCDGNIYADEDDGSGLCDQCSWWMAQ